MGKREEIRWTAAVWLVFLVAGVLLMSLGAAIDNALFDPRTVETRFVVCEVVENIYLGCRAVD